MTTNVERRLQKVCEGCVVQGTIWAYRVCDHDAIRLRSTCDPYVLMRSCIAKPTISLPTLYTSVISCLQTYGRNSHLSVTERWECFRTFVNTIFSASGRFLSTGALGALSPEAFLGSPTPLTCAFLSHPGARGGNLVRGIRGGIHRGSMGDPARNQGILVV